MVNDETTTNEQEIRQELMNIVREHLPIIVETLAPQIIELLKTKIDSSLVVSSTQPTDPYKAKEDFNKFADNHKRFVNDKLAERENVPF